MSLLYISSSHRDERTTDSANWLLRLPHTYNKVSKVNLLVYNIPNSVFNVRKDINDTIVFSLPDIPTLYPGTEPVVNENTAKEYPIKLDEGFYSLKDLQNAIQLKSQEAFTADGRSENIKVVLDELTNKLTFEEEANYVFRINAAHSAYTFDSELIGLPFNFQRHQGKTRWNSKQKMVNSVNLAVKTIFLTILFNDTSGYDVMSADAEIFASFIVPVDNVWSAIVFGRGENTITFTNPLNISRLRIQWADARGRPLRLDTPWELVLSLS